MLAEARRQMAAAQHAGLKVEWLVAEQKALTQLAPRLAMDVSHGPAGIALARALVFERWPDLVDADRPFDPLQRFYNRYFWFRRFAALWQAEHGDDAGIEQQAFDILGQAEVDVDWDLVEQLHERAREGTEPSA